MITIENIREQIKEKDFPALFKKAGLTHYAEAAEELVVFVNSMVDQGVFEEFAKADDTRPILQEQIDGLNAALKDLKSGEAKEGENAQADSADAPTQLDDITEETRLADILAVYPELKQQMAEIHPRFKMLQTPLARVMLPKATVSMMSNRSGMPVDELIAAIKKKIGMA